MASSATPEVCNWEVTDGRWQFEGGKAQLNEALIVLAEESSAGDVSRWNVSNGRWSYACAKTVELAPESPFHVPAESVGTPQGPNLTPGKPLCFLSATTPDSASSQESVGSGPARIVCKEALYVALGTPDSESQLEAGVDDNDMEMMLEAVEPMLPGEFQHSAFLPGEESAPAASGRSASAWKKIPSPATAIPNAARQVSAQAQKAKGHVSDKMHKSLGYVKEHTEGKLHVPTPLRVSTQVSETVQKSLGYVKGQTESARKVPAQVSETARKVPAQVSETAQKGFGYVKGQTESARKVPAQMSESAQKGLGYAKGKALEIARGMRRPQAKSGGA